LYTLQSPYVKCWPTGSHSFPVSDDVSAPEDSLAEPATISVPPDLHEQTKYTDIIIGCKLVPTVESLCSMLAHRVSFFPKGLGWCSFNKRVSNYHGYQIVCNDVHITRQCTTLSICRVMMIMQWKMRISSLMMKQRLYRFHLPDA